MVKEETISKKLIRHYSDDESMALLQIETGNVYEDAIDLIPCKYTYEEIAKETENIEI